MCPQAQKEATFPIEILLKSCKRANFWKNIFSQFLDVPDIFYLVLCIQCHFFFSRDIKCNNCKKRPMRINTTFKTISQNNINSL